MTPQLMRFYAIRCYEDPSLCNHSKSTPHKSRKSTSGVNCVRNNSSLLPGQSDDELLPQLPRNHHNETCQLLGLLKHLLIILPSQEKLHQVVQQEVSFHLKLVEKGYHQYYSSNQVGSEALIIYLLLKLYCYLDYKWNDIMKLTRWRSFSTLCLAL